MNGDEDFGKFINHLARARAKADENLQYFHQIVSIINKSQHLHLYRSNQSN